MDSTRHGRTCLAALVVIIALPHHLVQAAPSNDMFDAAAPLDGLIGSVNGDNAEATMEAGEDYPVGAFNRSVWYSWQAPRDCQMNMRADRSPGIRNLTLYVCTGDSVSNVALVAVDYSSGGASCPLVVFPAESGVVYRIQVAAYQYSTAAAGPFVLDWAETGSGPPNDNFANATLLTGSAGAAETDNTNATVEIGEPLYSDPINGGKSVWFAWTAPTTGMWSFATDGSTFDTCLGIYTGGQVQALQQVAWNDDAEFNYSASQLTVAVDERTTYYILVDGYESANGTVRLAYAPMCPNDSHTNALPLGGMSGSVSANNLGATEDPGALGGWRSVWYRWTAASNHTVNVNTAGSAFDTRLDVYSGPSAESLTLVGSNDDASPEHTLSELTFSATEGTTYHIAINGTRSSAKGIDCGEAQLNWFPHPAIFTALQLQGQDLEMSFFASPSRAFQLQTSASLTASEWEDAAAIDGHGKLQNTVVQINGQKLFYRIKTVE